MTTPTGLPTFTDAAPQGRQAALIAVSAINLAEELAKLRAPTSHAKTIRQLAAAGSPDPAKLEGILLEQRRELTAAKAAHSGEHSRRTIAAAADRCFDLARACQTAFRPDAPGDQQNNIAPENTAVTQQPQRDAK